MHYFSTKKVRRKLFKRVTGVAFCLLLVLVFAHRSAQGAITSVTLVPGAPTSMSTGQGFYLAAKTYTFTVTVNDPVAATWADISDVRVTIPGLAGGALVVYYDPAGPTAAVAANVTAAQSANVNATVAIAGTVNNFTATFNIAFYWVQSGNLDAAWGLRNISAQATSSNTLTTNIPTTYGVCGTVAMFGFSQNGDAADGYISDWHTGFNVTGYLVYNIGGAGIADSVSTVSAGEVSNTEIYNNGAGTGVTAVPAPLCTYAIGAGTITGMGTHAWTVRPTMTTTVVGGPLATVSGFSVYNDRVEVTNVEFIGGGGMLTIPGPPRQYYQCIQVAGTQVRVTARMQDLGTAMIGNTTVVIRDTTAGINYSVFIANGANTGVANIAPYPGGGGAGTLTPHTYRAETVSGGATDAGQNAFGRITQPANTIVRWDDQDPPGASAMPFTAGFAAPTVSASSVTLTWTALAGADPDLDFYTYRIYYKRTVDPTWTMVDRTTAPPATYAVLGTIGTASFSITGLVPLTSYDFRLSAVDIFGNEVAVGNQPTVTIATAPLQIDVTVTDGISTYTENMFDNPDPAAHPLRETAIKISVYVLTAGAPPDAVNVIAASNASDLLAQFGVTGANNDILTLTDNVDRWTFPCVKMSANTWETYIPTTHPLVKIGTNIRFIVDTVSGSVASHNDHTDEAAPPGNYIDDEWRVSISQPVVFFPWPVRILNNVMTKYQPCCYPAFYLPFDSLVTIKVYDIKGRVVAVLLDRQYRRGGQNIKEGGWCGLNKDNRKVGPGLYYINIRAVTIGGRVLIDKTKKVVVKW